MKDKKFLLIITYGRSGSTLLMGILNSIPGFRIMGENQDAYASLLTFYIRLMDSLASNKIMEKNWKVYKSCNSWWNEFDPDKIKERLRDVMVEHLDPYDNARVVGFKEINYGKHLKLGRDNLWFYLEWLHSVTGGCRFIWLTRNLDDVCKSEWWSESPPEDIVKKLGNFECFMEEYIGAHSGSQDWFHLCYEDMIVGKLEDFFVWLGESFDKKRVDRVLRIPHGYKSKGKIKTGGME